MNFNFYHDNVQLAFYKNNIVVNILVSVPYDSHKHRADYTTVYYTLNTMYKLHNTNKNSQMVPFLIAVGSQIWILFVVLRVSIIINTLTERYNIKTKVPLRELG